jgi:hypothetical protein
LAFESHYASQCIATELKKRENRFGWRSPEGSIGFPGVVRSYRFAFDFPRAARRLHVVATHHLVAALLMRSAIWVRWIQECPARQAAGPIFAGISLQARLPPHRIFLFLGEVWRENEQTSVRPGQSSSLLDLLGLSLACLRELSAASWSGLK